MWIILASSTPGLYNVYDDDGNPVAVDCTADRAMVIASAPEMLEVLKTVEPFVGRWHDRMAQIIGEMHDRAEEKFSLEKAGFFQYIKEARNARQIVHAVIAKAGG